MGPKSKNEDNVDTIVTTETVKAKRGRKSKKELMAALNMEPLIKEKCKNPISNAIQHTVDLHNSEIKSDIEIEVNTISDIQNNLFETPNVKESDNLSNIIITTMEKPEEQKIAKKRGRKPKGGKIIQHIENNEPQKKEKPNVILHLKCSMKDLQSNSQNNNFIESYNLLAGKCDLKYELIGNENGKAMNIYGDNDINSTTMTMNDECDDYDNDTICKDSTKEIWKKLKQLEHNLHVNNVNNKRSSCFWDTCEFDNPPIYIPKHFINGTYHVYGCFCSPECGVAYLMNENIDSSSKFERYHLFNNIYAKIYDYKKNIKPAPNPYYMLEKYYGNLSIQEYRSLLRNERLFLIVDKPLTRILPELHEDNDDFILNNKIIPSNNYNVKSRLQRKKPNKSSILNEKFGTVNSVLLE